MKPRGGRVLEGLRRPVGGPAVATDHRAGLIHRWLRRRIGDGEAESTVKATQHYGHYALLVQSGPKHYTGPGFAAVFGSTSALLMRSHFSTRVSKHNILA